MSEKLDKLLKEAREAINHANEVGEDAAAGKLGLDEPPPPPKPKSFMRKAFENVAYYGSMPVWKPFVWAWNIGKSAAGEDMGIGSRAARVMMAGTLAALQLGAVAGGAMYSWAYKTAVLSDSIIPFSEGTNRGIVQKVRYKGTIWPCKTYEISMAQDTYDHNESGSFSNRFNFSVRQFAPFALFGKPDIVQQLERLAETGQKIQISYKQSQIGAEHFNDTSSNSFFDSLMQCVQKSSYTLSSDDIVIIGPGNAAAPVPGGPN